MGVKRLQVISYTAFCIAFCGTTAASPERRLNRKCNQKTLIAGKPNSNEKYLFNKSTYVEKFSKNCLRNPLKYADSQKISAQKHYSNGLKRAELQ